MSTTRRLTGLAAATGMLLAVGVLHAQASRAETIHQDPFAITVPATARSVAWTSPAYRSSTGDGYACADVTALSAHVSYWTVTLYVTTRSARGKRLWTSPHETSAKLACSRSWRAGPKPVRYYVRVRVHASAGTSGQASGVSDIYTGFRCPPHKCGKGAARR